MDKFGYIRGRRGPAGPPGKDAFNLYAWCPKALLQLFWESESCTYLKGTYFRENKFLQELIFARIYFRDFDKNREIRENLFPRNILKIKNSRNFPQKLAVTWK